MAYYSNAQIVQKHLIDEFLGSLSSQLEILFTTQGESFITAATKCTYRCKDIRQCIGFEICKIREDLYQCRACCAWKKLGQERTNNNLNTCRYLRMVEKENIDKINVAVNKPASIISLYDPRYHHASNAVDNVTVCENGLSTAHTKKEINPWIKIDLQNTFDVVEVLVYNRQDSFVQIFNKPVGGAWNFKMNVVGLLYETFKTGALSAIEPSLLNGSEFLVKV
ncbi:uncharacterized protein LOC133194477 [Saccostrea echinata]|uniref:uncharacterized protein LOC133194477 n=1 Tax=Saccostrea echinata TaxID=191078 RepID=UPI002A80C6A7|nr:uncharacterized protein LOC133194477 [Saccostrea echinata]